MATDNYFPPSWWHFCGMTGKGTRNRVGRACKECGRVAVEPKPTPLCYSGQDRCESKTCDGIDIDGDSCGATETDMLRPEWAGGLLICPCCGAVHKEVTCEHCDAEIQRMEAEERKWEEVAR